MLSCVEHEKSFITSGPDRLNDPKVNKNVISTMVKYWETFYGSHTALKVLFAVIRPILSLHAMIQKIELFIVSLDHSALSLFGI